MPCISTTAIKSPQSTTAARISGFLCIAARWEDGLLTCHWHEARFDLCSGCTFDLWADDVPVFDTELRDGDVYVAARPRHAEDTDHYRRRLTHGLKHNISLIQAKAILGLRQCGVEWIEILREVRGLRYTTP